jgi:hypothetical protein
MARSGRPAIALVTTHFLLQGDFVARAAGMPDVPRVEIPHPVAGTGAHAMARVAASIAPQLRALLWTAS